MLTNSGMLRFSHCKTSQSKLALRFGSAGFIIAAILAVYAVCLSAHNGASHHDQALFFFLCPASIGAEALDNAGVLGGIFGWLIISVGNGALYAGVGFLIGVAARK